MRYQSGSTLLTDSSDPTKYTKDFAISTVAGNSYSRRSYLTIGGTCQSSGNKYAHFFGGISKASIYNTALTDSEVLQNYNANKTYHGIT